MFSGTGYDVMEPSLFSRRTLRPGDIKCSFLFSFKRRFDPNAFSLKDEKSFNPRLRFTLAGCREYDTNSPSSLDWYGFETSYSGTVGG